MRFQTVIESLRSDAEEIKDLLKSFRQYISITDLSAEDRRKGYTHVIHVMPYAWNDLGVKAKPLQDNIHEKYRKFHEFISCLTRSKAEQIQTEVKEAHDVITSFIEQGTAFSESVDKEMGRTTDAIDKLINLIGNLFSPEGQVIFVPDTNALLFNTALDRWQFDRVPKFRIVLVPAVLSELDKLKIDHRNEEVRKKADALIRQIKEFRRRGSLHSGVVLRRDVSEIAAIAVEPRMSETLSWFMVDNKDDQFLAACIEVMRSHLHSAVILVTRDINLQNKAEFARLPFTEPPEES